MLLNSSRGEVDLCRSRNGPVPGPGRVKGIRATTADKKTHRRGEWRGVKWGRKSTGENQSVRGEREEERGREGSDRRGGEELVSERETGGGGSGVEVDIRVIVSSSYVLSHRLEWR